MDNAVTALPARRCSRLATRCSLVSPATTP